MPKSIYHTHVPDSGGDLYLKLKDNETVKVRIASEPAIFETENERDGKITISTRYGWIVWNVDKQIPQIMQQSATFFKSIANLAQDEEYGDPDGYDIKITRNGTGTDTTYAVVPSANREPLSITAKKAVAEIDLVGKLKASPFSQRVSWLADFDGSDKQPAEDKSEGLAQQAQDKREATVVAQAPKKDDVVIEDIGDAPVNLDDIPF